MPLGTRHPPRLTPDCSFHRLTLPPAGHIENYRVECHVRNSRMWLPFALGHNTSTGLLPQNSFFPSVLRILGSLETRTCVDPGTQIGCKPWYRQKGQRSLSQLSPSTTDKNLRGHSLPWSLKGVHLCVSCSLLSWTLEPPLAP